jgi:hypothetical protein
VINRPVGIGVFEFAVLASLRSAQLCRGCVPRVDGDHTVAVTAQMEVACGAVSHAPAAHVAVETPELVSPLSAAPA